MKKQLLLFVMILLPIVANANNSGSCGNNLSWQYTSSNKTLTISGTGEMWDYTYEPPSPWRNLPIEKVIVNEGVTSIGNQAFTYMGNLISVSLPNTIKTIGKYAFSQCEQLTSLNIPKGLTSINEGMIQGCYKLTSIEIPNTVTSIGYGAFWSCT